MHDFWGFARDPDAGISLLCITFAQAKSCIKEKCCRKLHQGVLLLHDNSLHTSAVAKAAIGDCGFTGLEHSPYNIDMASSGYDLFTNLKRDLCGIAISNDNDL